MAHMGAEEILHTNVRKALIVILSLKLITMLDMSPEKGGGGGCTITRQINHTAAYIHF